MANRKPSADPFTNLINAYFKTDILLAQALGVTRQTAQRKRTHPNSFTLEEIRKLEKHLPKEEMRGALI